jgi:hypothetical protein
MATGLAGSESGIQHRLHHLASVRLEFPIMTVMTGKIFCWLLKLNEAAWLSAVIVRFSFPVGGSVCVIKSTVTHSNSGARDGVAG